MNTLFPNKIKRKHEECGPDCLVVNRDGTIVCRETGRCHEQHVSRNDYTLNHSKLFDRMDRNVRNVKVKISRRDSTKSMWCGGRYTGLKHKHLI